VKLDRYQIKLHAPWAVSALAMTLLLASWHVLASWRAGTWVGGSSGPGLVCGILAALIIVFEMLLWPRKHYRRLRLIATKHWLAAHVWLGLACAPLALLHCGWHFGGMLPTLLLLLLGVTLLSGIHGLTVQTFLPGWMLRHVPAETIYSQMDHVAGQAVEDFQQLLRAACGPPPRSDTSPHSARAEADLDAAEIEPDLGPRAVVVGAVREIGRSRGRTLETRIVVSSRKDAPILWNAFSELENYLRQGESAGGPLRDTTEARRWFDALRRSCEDSSKDVLDSLEQICDQRRQFDLQGKAHRYLHGWLPVHVGLSVGLSVLLIVHIWTALRYW